VTRSPSELADRALLRRVARGDRAAFEELHDRLAPMVLLRLRRRCADPDVVADVLQDTFLAVWRCAGDYRQDGEVAAWVWTIASRRLVDAFRRRAVRIDAAAVPALPEPTQAHPSAEEVALGLQLEDPLRIAIARLSPDLRAVLQATVLDDLSVRDASVLLGIPEGTVKTRARRARLQLREALS